MLAVRGAAACGGVLMSDRLIDALAALESAARESDPAEVPALVGDLERVKAIAWARLAVPATTNGAGDDRLLTLHQAAVQLGVPEGWIKKRPDLPFRVVLSEGTVRYSARGIESYIRTRAGR